MVCSRCDQHNELAPGRSWCKGCEAKRFKAWYEANKKAVIEKVEERNKKSPLRSLYKRAQSARRRARKRQADTGRLTTEDVKAILSRDTCFYCKMHTKKKARQLEHKTPLSRGGYHDPSNLVMSCAVCNMKKGTNTAPEFQAWLMTEEGHKWLNKKSKASGKSHKRSKVRTKNSKKSTGNSKQSSKQETKK